MACRQRAVMRLAPRRRNGRDIGIDPEIARHALTQRAHRSMHTRCVLVHGRIGFHRGLAICEACRQPGVRGMAASVRGMGVDRELERAVQVRDIRSREFSGHRAREHPLTRRHRAPRACIHSGKAHSSTHRGRLWRRGRDATTGGQLPAVRRPGHGGERERIDRADQASVERDTRRTRQSREYLAQIGAGERRELDAKVGALEPLRRSLGKSDRSRHVQVRCRTIQSRVNAADRARRQCRGGRKPRERLDVIAAEQIGDQRVERERGLASAHVQRRHAHLEKLRAPGSPRRIGGGHRRRVRRHQLDRAAADLGAIQMHREGRLSRGSARPRAQTVESHGSGREKSGDAHAPHRQRPAQQFLRAILDPQRVEPQVHGTHRRAQLHAVQFDPGQKAAARAVNPHRRARQRVRQREAKLRGPSHAGRNLEQQRQAQRNRHHRRQDPQHQACTGGQGAARRGRRRAGGWDHGVLVGRVFRIQMLSMLAHRQR